MFIAPGSADEDLRGPIARSHQPSGWCGGVGHQQRGTQRRQMTRGQGSVEPGQHDLGGPGPHLDVCATGSRLVPMGGLGEQG